MTTYATGGSGGGGGGAAAAANRTGGTWQHELTTALLLYLAIEDTSFDKHHSQHAFSSECNLELRSIIGLLCKMHTLCAPTLSKRSSHTCSEFPKQPSNEINLITTHHFNIYHVVLKNVHALITKYN
ncbi:hypothetical protein T05_10731 [Trichinella murrelli]|uniref:Uncharacterized protein n=1 Tax=Trichinella murrelli TaxID=144512 RepID=A0A0V0UHX9_9BILA|nr:hypothetical protein T05_10731 [Trichinella murrelli]